LLLRVEGRSPPRLVRCARRRTPRAPTGDVRGARADAVGEVATCRRVLPGGSSRGLRSRSSGAHRAGLHKRTGPRPPSRAHARVARRPQRGGADISACPRRPPRPRLVANAVGTYWLGMETQHLTGISEEEGTFFATL